MSKRSVKNLKKAYTNLKRGTRKRVANDKIETYKTGGGSKMTKLDSSSEKVMAIIQEQSTPIVKNIL